MKAKGQSIAERFIWSTQTGQQIKPHQMSTTHLFYSVRMIFNHTAPAAYQIAGCKRYAGPADWPANYRRLAVHSMLAELARRGPLPAWMMNQIAHMAKAAVELSELRLSA